MGAGATCAAIGSFGKLLVQGGNTPRTFGVSSERYSFLYETLKSRRRLIGLNAIQGALDIDSDRAVAESYRIGGRIAMQPGPADLDAWLQRGMGGTKSGNIIDFASPLPDWDVLVHRDEGVFRYSTGMVDKLIFTARSGPNAGDQEILNMVVMAQFMTETEISWPGSEPSIPTGAQRTPYIFSQGVLNIGGTAYSFDAFQLIIDNGLVVRNRNSLTPTCMYPTQRRIYLSVNLPFLAANWTMANSAFTAPVTAFMTFTNGSRSCRFDFGALRNTRETPTITGKTEIPLNLNLEGYRNGATASLRATNIIV